MPSLRARVRLVLVGALAAALLGLATFGAALLDRVAAAASTGEPEHLHAQLQSAEIALWLACAALLALGLALGLAGLQAWLVRPLEALGRELAADPDLPSQPPLDELTRLRLALQHYRATLLRERAERSAHLGAVGRWQGAADAVQEQLLAADRLALVGQVALGVSHEVGGPLAVVTGWLERLRALELQEGTAQERLQALDKAEAAAGRIHAILSELARPGLPRPRDADRPADLLAVALRVVGQAEEHPRARQAQLAIEAADPTHPVDASASHLEQVLLNLVLNAADAIGRGHVIVRVQRDGDWQVCCVDDDGPGIPPEAREAIFEPFYSTKQGPGGVDSGGWGLGLAISRRLVATYGGTLEADTSPEGGARLRLRLPVPPALRGRSAVR